MRYTEDMNRRIIIMTAVLFGLIVFGMFVFAYLKAQERSPDNAPSSDVSKPATGVDTPPMREINAYYKYEAGTHFLEGVMMMPTPCHELVLDAYVQESFPEQIILDFVPVTNAEFCAQTLTPVPYALEIDASEEALFHTHYAGRDVQLVLLPDSAERPAF